MTRTYNDLIQLQTYDERVKYLQTFNSIGQETFGGHRYLNQRLYQMPEWKSVRAQVIIRDNGCDLGLQDRPIPTRVIVHHIEPITIEDIVNRDPKVLDPNNLIAVSPETHNYIHYGNEPRTEYKERTAGDTCPWRK